MDTKSICHTSLDFAAQYSSDRTSIQYKYECPIVSDLSSVAEVM